MTVHCNSLLVGRWFRHTSRNIECHTRNLVNDSTRVYITDWAYRTVEALLRHTVSGMLGFEARKYRQDHNICTFGGSFFHQSTCTPKICLLVCGCGQLY